MFIDIRSVIVCVHPAVSMGFFAHTFDEKQTGKHHTDLDSNNQIKDNCQYKCYYQYKNVTLRSCLDQVAEGSPLTHIIGNDKKNRSNGRHRNHSGIRHQNDQHDDECDGVYHSGDGSPPAIFDICSSSGDGTCCGNTAKECGSDVAGSLGNQFHIRTMFAVDHSIGNYT